MARAGLFPSRHRCLWGTLAGVVSIVFFSAYVPTYTRHVVISTEAGRNPSASSVVSSQADELAINRRVEINQILQKEIARLTQELAAARSQISVKPSHTTAADQTAAAPVAIEGAPYVSKNVANTNKYMIADHNLYRLNLNEVFYKHYSNAELGLIGPMTIEELELCRTTPCGPSSPFLCEQDTTCLKCVRPILQQFYAAFKEKAFTPGAINRRRAVFENIKRLSGVAANGRTTPLAFIHATDIKFVRLLMNWFCSIEHLGVDIKDSVVVIALDTEVADVLKRLKLHVLDQQDFGYSASEVWRAPGNDQSVKGLFYIAMSEAIHLNISMAFNDADTVWIKDVREYLANEASQQFTDVVTMLAPTFSSNGQANTGFTLVRANEKTKGFMATLANTYPLMMQMFDDQRIFNSLLRHWKYRQVTWANLPKNFFGIDYSNASTDAGDVYYSHVVGKNGKKEEFLRKGGLWFFDETCSLYKDFTGPKEATQ